MSWQIVGVGCVFGPEKAYAVELPDRRLLRRHPSPRSQVRTTTVAAAANQQDRNLVTVGQTPFRVPVNHAGVDGSLYQRGVCDRVASGRGREQVTRAVRVLAVPAAHAYPMRLRLTDPALCGSVDYLADPVIDGAEPGRWWPPPALDSRWVDEHAGDVDVVHLHFGFDASTPEQLTAWCDSLDRQRIPLVLTVHDLANPHFADQTDHEARLATLVPRAAVLTTLTPGAAAEAERRWGRSAYVVPHPHVAPLARIGTPSPRTAGAFVVGLHLKSLRANVVAAPVVEALVDGLTDLPGSRLTVHLHREVLSPAHPRHDPELLALVHHLADERRLELTLHEPQSDTQLWDYLRGLDVSVLPYAWGTHSGWLEACHDLGTPVLAPRTGYWTQQRPCRTFGWGSAGPDRVEIAQALECLHRERPRWQATRRSRRQEQREVAAWHASRYRSLVGEPRR